MYVYLGEVVWDGWYLRSVRIAGVMTVLADGCCDSGRGVSETNWVGWV